MSVRRGPGEEHQTETRPSESRRRWTRELGQHAPTAYAATKEQLHQPARTAIDAGAETGAKVRASWMSDDTRARVTAFIDALARD
jgi:enoyl-CoA hydratase